MVDAALFNAFLCYNLWYPSQVKQIDFWYFFSFFGKSVKKSFLRTSRGPVVMQMTHGIGFLVENAQKEVKRPEN